MGFFDSLQGKLNDAGKSIKQAGENAAQSTKDFADKTKLNNQIHQFEKDVDAQYKELGKLLYEEKSEEVHAAAPEIADRIDVLKDNIEKLKEQVAAIGAKKICPVCGRQNDPDAKFCVQCGSPLNVDPSMKPAEDAAQEEEKTETAETPEEATPKETAQPETAETTEETKPETAAEPEDAAEAKTEEPETVTGEVVDDNQTDAQ